MMQLKARVFEVPTAGGFLLTENSPDQHLFYEIDKEQAVFETVEELVEKARYYLSHPDERDAMALAAYERTQAEHTYEQRFTAVFDFALAQRNRSVAGRAAPDGRIDWATFEQAARRHRLSPGLRLLKAGLEQIGTAIYGPRRGLRAARRLMFELSWRLSGEHTYSAAGWPGRLFYNAT
jgi:spore maturation protein CgeB